MFNFYPKLKSGSPYSSIFHKLWCKVFHKSYVIYDLESGSRSISYIVVHNCFKGTKLIEKQGICRRTV